MCSKCPGELRSARQVGRKAPMLVSGKGTEEGGREWNNWTAARQSPKSGARLSESLFWMAALLQDVPRRLTSSPVRTGAETNNGG